MGFKETWLLVPQADAETVLARMALRPARPGDGPPVARAMRLPPAAGGHWTLLSFDHYAEATQPFLHEPAQAAWSLGTELLGLEINEGANFSVAFGWRDGGSRWTLQHVLDEGQEHLDVRGEPPAGWQALRDRELARLRAGEVADFMFSVPIDALALRIGVTPYTFDADEGDEPAVPLVREMPPLDDETLAQLPPTGDRSAPPAPVLSAAGQGNAEAQCQIGLALLRARPENELRRRLAQLWLERAAYQGEAGAQALLGSCLHDGRPGFTLDARRGLQWLELSAAQDHLEGLRRLAQQLYEPSIHRRDGYVRAAEDATSTARLARMLALLERGVALGGRGCLVDLTHRVHDGIGALPDVVAAKALAQLAVAQAPQHLPQDRATWDTFFAPTPEEAAEVGALAGAWSASGPALVRGLRERRQAQQARLDALQAQARTARAAARDAQQRLDGLRERQRSERALARAEALDALLQTRDGRPVGRLRWAPGFTALLLAIGLTLLAVGLAPRASAGVGRGVVLLAGLCGAWGAWRVGGVRGWGTAARAALAAAMLLPMVGLLLSVWLILKQVRER